MIEMWKDIDGFEGLYQISNYGRVKGLVRNKILKPSDNGNGYLYVMLSKNNKPYMRKVARLVAQHFLTNPKNLKEVNHIDQNKHNNIVSNLEWISRKDNVRYSMAKKVIQYDLYGNKLKIWNSINEASKALNISSTHISEVCRNLRKTANKFYWQYL